MNRVRGLLVALVLALLIGTVQSVIVRDPCYLLSPDNWFWWWFYSCGGPSAGGGGGGAG